MARHDPVSGKNFILDRPMCDKECPEPNPLLKPGVSYPG